MTQRNQKKSAMHHAWSILLVSLMGFLFFAGTASAATITLDPAKGAYGPGDTFVVTVRLDTDPDECVNAVNVELHYPPEVVRATAVSKGESLLTLWPEEPRVDLAGGNVYFQGGVPAGYCGRVLGDPGKTNILAKVIFSIPQSGSSTPATAATPFTIDFSPNSSVLLNDGFGTPAQTHFTGASLVRTITSKGKPQNEWLDMIHSDTTPPDLFTISLEQDAHTFQGQYFIVFAAIDKQSGVHHYEVIEDDPLRFGIVRGSKEKALFIEAKSPYLLRDQTLGSRIIVRAYDQAGNMQEAMYAPRNGMQGQFAGNSGGMNWPHLVWVIVLTALACTLCWWFFLRSKNALPPEGGVL